MVYGDSAEQGLVRGNVFYHPKLGFKFSVPLGFKIVNSPAQVVATSNHGVMMVFDFAKNSVGHSPSRFLRDVWMENSGGQVHDVEAITVNGMSAATGYVKGSIGGKAMQIRLIAIAFNDHQIARFQIGIPAGLSRTQMDEIKAASYSFSRLSSSERLKLKPFRIQVVVAKHGDSVSSLSRRMTHNDSKEQRFRVLNGLHSGQRVVAGRLYKIVTE